MEAKALIDDALAGQGGIAVEKDAHGAAVGGLVVVVVLDGADLAENDGVLGLQMRRVGHQGQLHALSRRRRALEAHAKMVLDITRALVLSAGGAGKLAEDGLVGFPDDVAEHVETAAVGHANDDVLDAVVDAAVDEGLHAGDEGLAALKAEALVVGVLCGQEGLERGAPDEAVEDAALLVDGVLEGLGHLDALTQPVALFPVGNVDELDAVGAAVDLLAGGDDLAERHLLAAVALETRQDARAQGVLGVEILLGELVVLELELLGADVAETLGGVADAQGVDPGLVVAAGLVCAHKQLHLEMVCDVGALANANTSAGSEAHDGLGAGHEGRRRGECLGDGHIATLHVLEVDLPRDVDALRVLLPLEVHLVDVVGSVPGEEAVVRVGRVVEGAVEAFLRGEGERTAVGSEPHAGARRDGGSREAS